MKTKIPLKILKIDKDGFHLSVSARINGKVAHLVVDTGASRSVFDKERIKNFVDKEEIRDIEKLSTGLGTNSMQSQCTLLSAFKIGTIEIKDFECILLDLAHVNQSYEMIGLKPVEGVIGSDILKKYNALIDYKNRLLILQQVKKKKAVRK
jgi:predicted aspartyl protease